MKLPEEKLIELIKDLIQDAKKDLTYAHREDCNSYASGYEAGYIGGLDHALQLIEKGEIE